MIIRFNLLCCFSKIFFQKRSKAFPPNFSPPFCAFCLIVCDFLPETWDLGRKEGKFALSGGAPLPSAPVGRSHLPQGEGFPRPGEAFSDSRKACDHPTFPYLFVPKSVRNAQDGCFSSVVPVYWIRFPILTPALDFTQEFDTFLTRRNRVLRPLAAHPIQTTLWNKC